MKNLERASPAEMSASARAGELTAILATAIIRSQLARTESQREIELGFVPDQRVHTTPYQEEKL